MDSETLATFSNLDEASNEIWRVCLNLRGTSHVERSGFGLCGCYPYELADRPKPEGVSAGSLSVGNRGEMPSAEPMRAESVAEHMYATMTLLYLLSVFYPHLFMPGQREPVTLQDLLDVKYATFRMMVLLMFHDSAEVSPELGDAPDDGSQNRKEKDRIERKHITMLTERFPPALPFAGVHDARAELWRDFRQFQHPLEKLAPQDTMFQHQLVQVARVCDKADAVLGGIAYERAGYGGDLRYKVRYFSGITEQDQHFIEVTGGDSSLVATWAAHFICDYHNYRGFKEALGVIRAGVVETRGEWFPWWRDYAQELGIPDYGW